MSGDNRTLDRRTVLKSTGIAASGLLASTGVTTADEPMDPTVAEDRALESEHVRSILAKLGRPEIDDVSSRNVTVEDRTFLGIDLETEWGTLTYGEDEDGSGTALFEFDETVRTNARSELPREYRLPPQTEDAILTIDADEGVVFMRTATPSEQRRLAAKTGVDPDDAAMFYDSLIDGFEVHLTDEAAVRDENVRAYLVRPSAGSTSANVGAGINSKVTDLSAMETNEVTASSCSEWAFSCMGSITICSACLMACGSAPVNPPAVAGCVLCVTGSCGLAVPVSCTKVVDECV